MGQFESAIRRSTITPSSPLWCYRPENTVHQKKQCIERSAPQQGSMNIVIEETLLLRAFQLPSEYN
ncbi:hypothetical protein KIN20_009103 [Parelaphostrongylus tenuis]|uniref:Uncharacterized protein n=1 Tax=Parelaphostrongylus tenuis TaxID=148309 RepID=A0AAD5MNN3_PARTN|nr:hypothetical protein KIN20_009103 [Parelaphostrongylus tenuis]